MDSNKHALRNKFKAPEGCWLLAGEKLQGLIPFAVSRCSRISVASREDGSWMLYNIGDYLHISGAGHKEPARSLMLGNSASRVSTITCHAHSTAKDGIDTVVGLADGQVLLLSLKAQLQAPASAKPILACSLAPEASNEAARCNAVTWLPRTDGVFAAAFASGCVYLYKKSNVLGEGSSRFSLSIGSSSKASAPVAAWPVLAGPITDLAASPCGTLLAAACRDGALRLLDVATGQVTGGFQSYYGAVLCCSFSPDGRYVAAGGEDDLVAVYGVAERCPVAHCQGHTSWVSRVTWDPWLMLSPSTPGGAPSSSALSAQAGGGPGEGGAGLASGGYSSRSYRLASVGQDCGLCLWEVQVVPAEGGDLMVSTGMRRSGSTATLSSPTRAAADSGAGSGGMPGGHTSASGGGAPGHQRKPSLSSKAPGGGVSPPVHSVDMNIVQPIMQCRVHPEPMSDIVFTDSHALTADHSGCCRTWQRPEALQRRSMTHRAGLQAATGPSP